MTATQLKNNRASDLAQSAFKPNEEQQVAIDKFLTWLNDRDADQLFELDGKSGAGKSSTLAWMLKSAGLSRSAVVLAAPVNKAAFVLQSTLHKAELPRYDCKTIYSALGICVVDYDEHGNPIFGSKGDPRKVEGLKLLIIDEKSMIGEQLLNIITTCAPSSLKILFCGDSFQLPPVEASKPLILSKRDYEAGQFTDPFALSPSIGCALPENTAELVKIMRQDGGCVMDLLASIRSTIAEADQFMADLHRDPMMSWSFTPSLSLFQDERDESLQEYDSRLALMQKAIELFSERKRVKVIAYQNRTVNYYQAEIFKQLFPNAETPYPVGAYIQLKDHWRNGGNAIVVPASSEGYVTESVLQKAWFMGAEIEYYGLAVDFGELFGTVLIKVPTSESAKLIKQNLEILKGTMNRDSGEDYLPDSPLKAIYQKCGLDIEVSSLATVAQAIGFSVGDIAREHGAIVLQAMQMGLLKTTWKQGWSFHSQLQSCFAQVEHGYSSTIYKAQGSTYDEVFFHNDMPRFSISEWALNRNAIDFEKVKAKLKNAYHAVQKKRGMSEIQYFELVWSEFEQWIEADQGRANDFRHETIHSYHEAVMSKLEALLENDQYLEAYTRTVRGMEPRLCLRALYVACSRHKQSLHFFDAAKSFD